ncbi:DTW domain-containing protein [Vibrio sp. L3-7]|uniref:tRNA-uridine aminocarboxypropyltransferase n=1 Tax=Vibrio sp. L3-7 TaxID=2912253 RepID=UPI00119420B2|nr:DTW domain-containing protein [Vibrio sp. L3-7]MCF7506732.1 DTW domain-containing protein [Vibrio sp. L3-7]TVU68257.1 DTW domain-containing protein [Vibrio tasmaniensis]
MGNQQACSSCGFTHQCICHLIPSIESQTDLVLLTHENELSRDTNTGKLLQQSLQQCQSFVWQRKTPPAELMALLEDKTRQPFLLFPSDTSIECQQAVITKAKNRKPLFIILDGTWQEAKKMLNKSIWLQAIPQVHLNITSESSYTLRRNQDSGHLCTCEVGVELLKALGEDEQAQQIDGYFQHYLKVFQADKCGHSLKEI